MKITTHLSTLFCGTLAVIALAAGCATEQSQAELRAQARVTQQQAEKTALAKVPNGTVKEAGLEKEHGKLIWSLDIATPGSKDITEVHVDAITGEIVRTENETPAQQEKEEKAKKKK